MLDIDELLIHLTADIASAHFSNNHVPIDEVSSAIRNVHLALSNVKDASSTNNEKRAPAASVSSSTKPKYLICLEDGIRLKTLKRHLRTSHGMSPEEYRLKWDLPENYPMVCRNYADKRRELAIKIGLGHMPGAGRKKGK